MTEPVNEYSPRRLTPIVPGRTYRYFQWRRVEREGQTVWENMPGALYRLEGRAYHGLTRQQGLVYRGLEGADAGWLFFCSEWDFAIRFELEPESDLPR